ncbi:MAG TPA: hypothetical protein VII45_01930 [Solirubrobacterales bacterium]
MPSGHADPIATITTDDVLTESQGFMLGRREEAQRILSRELKAGLSLREALTKARRPIRAGQLAQIKHRAELPYLAA